MDAQDKGQESNLRRYLLSDSIPMGRAGSAMLLYRVTGAALAICGPGISKSPLQARGPSFHSSRKHCDRIPYTSSTNHNPCFADGHICTAAHMICGFASGFASGGAGWDSVKVSLYSTI